MGRSRSDRTAPERRVHASRGTGRTRHLHDGIRGVHEDARRRFGRRRLRQGHLRAARWSTSFRVCRGALCRCWRAISCWRRSRVDHPGSDPRLRSVVSLRSDSGRAGFSSLHAFRVALLADLGSGRDARHVRDPSAGRAHGRAGGPRGELRELEHDVELGLRARPALGAPLGGLPVRGYAHPREGAVLGGRREPVVRDDVRLFRARPHAAGACRIHELSNAPLVGGGARQRRLSERRRQARHPRFYPEMYAEWIDRYYLDDRRPHAAREGLSRAREGRQLRVELPQLGHRPHHEPRGRCR